MIAALLHLRIVETRLIIGHYLYEIMYRQFPLSSACVLSRVISSLEYFIKPHPSNIIMALFMKIRVLQVTSIQQKFSSTYNTIIITTINYNVCACIQHMDRFIISDDSIGIQKLYRIATWIVAAFCGFETQVARKCVHQIRLMVINSSRANLIRRLTMQARHHLELHDEPATAICHFVLSRHTHRNVIF